MHMTRTNTGVARTVPSIWSIYNDRRMMVMILIGFSCGIPLFLTGSTLSLWLKELGFSNTRIGVLSLCALPYTFKFVWSPFIDRMRLPFLTKWLGRRRAWLLASQILLVGGILTMSQIVSSQSLFLTGVCAFFIAFAAATQDVVMLAYQVERLGKTQYGAGEASGIFGYRMGMLASGAGALYLAESMTWSEVYLIMSALVGLGIITTLMIKEPTPILNPESSAREDKAREYLNAHPRLNGWQANTLSWLYGAVICPFSDFMSRRGWLISIMIMLTYKLSDNLVGNMTNIFYDDMGFSKAEIAGASKVFGMANSIIGGFIGGLMIARLGIMKSLFINALVHGVSLLCHVAIAANGYDMSMLYLAVALEHITGGMRTTALFAYQMTLCNPVYAATQLALLTSCVSLGRALTAASSGFLADHLGWVNFFALCSFATLISLFFVAKLSKIEYASSMYRVKK